MADAVPDRTIQHLAMFTRLYVEALFKDEALAEHFWSMNVDLQL